MAGTRTSPFSLSCLASLRSEDQLGPTPVFLNTTQRQLNNHSKDRFISGDRVTVNHRSGENVPSTQGSQEGKNLVCAEEKICPRKSFLHRTCTCKRDAIAVSQVELHPTFFSEFGASARRARRESASRRFGCRPLSLGAQRRECHGALTGKVGYRPRAWRILAQHQADHRRQRDWPTICMARQ